MTGKTGTKRRGKKPGTVDDARRILWKALTRAEVLAEREEQEPGDVLRVLHAVAQGVAAYVRVCEVSDLEARLEALEQAEKERAEAEGGAGPRVPRRSA